MKNHFIVFAVIIVPSVAFASDFGGMLSAIALMTIVPLNALVSIGAYAGKQTTLRSALWGITTLGWLVGALFGVMDRRSSGLSTEGILLSAISALFIVIATIRFASWIRAEPRD